MAQAAPETRKASCVCGNLSATCAGAPVRVALCHCLACQKRTGSPYGIGAFFPREAVVVSGPAQSYTRPGDSGHTVTFHFCPTCGSTVYWEPAKAPTLIAVAVGAFADPKFPAPELAVYPEHRHDWVVVPGCG